MNTTFENPCIDVLLDEANTRESMQKFNEAIILYETVLAKNQSSFNAYLKLGALHERMADTEKAKDVYIKGIEAANYFQNKKAEIDLSYTLLGLIDF